MVVLYRTRMQISDSNLVRFRAWLLGRGRTEGTADLYVLHVRSSGSDPKGLTDRLVSGKLAPNTVRTNLAALRAWAMFRKDADLEQQLRDIRVPPARRVRHKRSLTLEDWRRAIHHVKACPMPNEAIRQVILLMAMRGLRCGDVLRMRRPEIRRSLDTGKLVCETKGRKRLQIDVSPIRTPLAALLAELDEARVEHVRDLVTTSTKPQAARRRMWRVARRTAAQIGIPEMSPHLYRHTFAQNYLRQLHGDPNALVKLQQFMGWEAIGTAARYVSDVSLEELDRIGADLVTTLMEETSATG